MSKISIIIPTVPENSELLSKVLTSLITYKDPSVEYEVLVEMNNWEGFSVPCNRAIKRSTGEYVLLLNDDVEFLVKGWERKMLAAFMNDAMVRIVGHVDTCNHGRYSALWFTLIDRRLFDEVGFLDEDLNLFSQDILLGWLAAKKGLKTVFVDCGLKHGGSKTVKRLKSHDSEIVRCKEVFKLKTGVDHDLA